MIEIRGNEVIQECGICNHKTKIELTEDELEAFGRFARGFCCWFIRDFADFRFTGNGVFFGGSFCFFCHSLKYLYLFNLIIALISDCLSAIRNSS